METALTMLDETSYPEDLLDFKDGNALCNLLLAICFISKSGPLYFIKFSYDISSWFWIFEVKLGSISMKKSLNCFAIVSFAIIFVPTMAILWEIFFVLVVFPIFCLFSWRYTYIFLQVKKNAVFKIFSLLLRRKSCLICFIKCLIYILFYFLF